MLQSYLNNERRGSGKDLASLRLFKGHEACTNSLFSSILEVFTMPRDLAKEATSDEMAQLNRSSSQGKAGETPGIPLDESTLVDILAQSTTSFAIYQKNEYTDCRKGNEKRDELHPYIQTLSLSDIDSCVRVEDETFPPQERCTREKVSINHISCTQNHPTVSMTCQCLGSPLCAVFCRRLHAVYLQCLLREWTRDTIDHSQTKRSEFVHL